MVCVKSVSGPFCLILLDMWNGLIKAMPHITYSVHVYNLVPAEEIQLFMVSSLGLAVH